MGFITTDDLKQSIMFDEWIIELEKEISMVGYPPELLSYDLSGDMNKLIIFTYDLIKKLEMNINGNFWKGDRDNLKRAVVALKQKYSARAVFIEDFKRTLK